MSFGRREQYDRRIEPRSDILKRASIVFGTQGTRVGGMIRNISLSGLRFVPDTPQNLPRHVSLDFGNGETFDCDVVREGGGLEFGLKFVDKEEFARSNAKENIDAIYQFTKSRTPIEIYDLMESVDFFGDEELEETMREYAAAHHRMVHLYRERILPQQGQDDLTI